MRGHEKMKQYKHMLCIITALLATGTLLACGDSAADTKETQAQTNSGTETEDSGLKSNLPEVDYEGATINILTAAEQWSRFYTIEKESGDIIEDAVYKRNREVSEDLNVNLNFMVFNGYTAGMDAVATALRGAVMGGTGEFDLYTASSAYVMGLMLDNLFCNLTDVEYLDFEQPWWISGINDRFMLNDKLYLCAGTLGMQYLDDARCIFFNKKLAGNLDINDLYASVNDGTWTSELFTQYCKLANADLNGDGKMDGADRYGYAGTDTEAIYALSFGYGKTNTYKDEDGIPRMVGATERMEDIFNALKPLTKDKTMYYGTEAADPSAELYPMFMADKALFINYTLNAVSGRYLSDMEDFGILPMPKYDEAQETYTTMGFADFHGIPRGVSEESIGRAGIVLEALNFENYKTVYPAYKDVALQRKYSRDEESADMIDIIFDGVFMDFGMVFYAQIDFAMLNMASVLEGNDSYATWWARNEKRLTKKLEEIVETISEFEDY